MLEAIQDTETEFSPDKVKKSWKAKIENKTLDSSDVISYFKISAPFFLNVSRKDNVSDIGGCTFDEDGAKTAIIDIVQEIILGNKWEDTLDKLKTGNNVSAVCGNIFKNGEPTYSCRECSVDPTCVLCASCFKKSSHRTHKYKMSTSFGGGVCDCGDREAWKKDYFCEDHAPAEPTEVDYLITDDIKEICRIVFHAILVYCVSMLQIDSDTSFPDIDSEKGQTEDMFCTLLYNDETHTFDQVINTLTSIVKCEQKEAVEYVTSIDRDGRSVVKCATFNACMKLKNEIEKKGARPTLSNSKLQPLKVAIFHKDTVACQTFALQLLHWFQDFLGCSAKFRAVFCEIILKAPSSSNYNLRQILLYDIKLWKTARSAWHRLIISGMLMEYENKKELAIGFTKVYTNIMQDFLRDDHYHSFSVVSMSVQLFTVPTIAHHLISQESAFFKLMHTYYAECIEKYVKNKTLVFPKNASALFNKRAHYILTDLRYLLTFKPEIWTQELRLGFLHGIQMVLRLLKCMQGMDTVTRQIGQHMEYEPEWESAFTLHIKLSSLITSIIEWCGTDKVILIKVYRMVLSALNETKFIINEAYPEVKELADHSASCLMYDVALKPVSIHLPLTRLLAGLYIHLQKFNLTFDNVSTTNDKPTAAQIIEPVLCTRTMISEVYAGMWRRNGYSLLNQLYFYRNVKCRSEMLDRDVIILQMGASLIESNEFLIHVMNKFTLLQWTEKDYKPVLIEEDTNRQIVNMIDEFLELLLVTIGERFMVGVGQITEDDRIKKEIIQQLCIKPLSHSEINKALNDEHCAGHECDIEPVIHEIAVFERPQTSDKKGVYKLKEEYYNEYNMYFYHYTREEKSKSEQVQLERNKTKNGYNCCPPPKLPLLAEPFTMIANLLQSDVMLLIMQTVLRHSADLNCQTFSEGHLQKVLHLIGYGIQEEESDNYPFLQFLERSSKWNLLQMMEELKSNPRVESQRDFLLWTIKKYKDQQTKNNSHNEQQDPVASPIPDDDNDAQMENEQAMKERRSKMAAQRREQLLAQMAKAQKSFITSHAEHFKDDVRAEDDTSMEWQSSFEEQRRVACIGNDRKIVHNDAETSTCILCSEESTNNSLCMVYPAFIQKSNVLGHHHVPTNEEIINPDAEIKASPYINSCGHEMHVTCWQDYFANEMQKENRRPFRTRNPSIFNIDKKQFLCPLCRFLSNAVLPIIPPLTSLNDNKAKNVTDLMNFDLWYQLMNNYVNSLHFIGNDMNIFKPGSLIKEEMQRNYQECVVGFLKEHCNFEENTAEPQIALNPDINKFSKEFMTSVKKISPTSGETDDLDLYTYAFQTCSYTIEAVEMYIRALDKPLTEMSVRYEKCITGLIRLCGYYGRMNFEILKEKESPSLTLSYYSLLICARDLYNTLFGKNPDESILHWNIFDMMVSLLFITRPVLFPQNTQYLISRGDTLDYSIFNAMFGVNLLKILLTVNLNDVQEMDYEDEESSQGTSNEELTIEDRNMLSIYEKYNIYFKDEELSEENLMKIKKQLVEALKDQSRTFLRCSCILFHYLTEVPLPDEMNILEGDTFEILADYLNVKKNLTTYFSESSMLNFLQQCAQHNAVTNYRNKLKAGQSKDLRVIRGVNPKVRQLVPLPDDYSDLINSVSLFTCRNNEREDSRNPTMCLVCGEVLCSQTYCCQREINKAAVGACNYHAETCGTGAGIYLRIRDAEILFLGQNTGCFLSAPYLDDYNETDQGLRRGNPLHLCHDSYKKLQQLWLSHSIHEEIARKTESQAQIFQIQWNHL
ncbi:unnamed protein product [Chironomus riparius]|uniref:E3 ubiquitin-protein ligase n=1 Tax=Chironomus riparius TaxID=315576 RepID=A0A9N9WRE0_9DIPT|nr:unnamed protein product [Chironomus riparius]